MDRGGEPDVREEWPRSVPEREQEGTEGTEERKMAAREEHPEDESEGDVPLRFALMDARDRSGRGADDHCL